VVFQARKVNYHRFVLLLYLKFLFCYIVVTSLINFYFVMLSLHHW
jgi:hypothetical protein